MEFTQHSVVAASAKQRLLTLLCFLFAISVNAAPDLGDFFKESCIQCHGEKKQKGKVRLDTLTWNPKDHANLEIWQAVFDQLETLEMPPDDEPQPTDAARKAATTAVRAALEEAADHGEKKQVLLRRLNRTQYRNTVRDLLGIDVQVDDPTKSFPSDDVVEGFSNVGEGLIMSDFLMRAYLKAARGIVDQATFEGSQPEAKTWPMFGLSPKQKRHFNWRRSAVADKRGVLNLVMNDEREPGDTRGQILTSSREGATHDGWYEFEFEVESKGRGTNPERYHQQKRKDWQVYYPQDLHRLEIYLSAPHGTTAVQTRNRILVDAYDLADGKRQTIKNRYWLNKGWRVEAAFGNGYSTSSTPNMLRLINPEWDKTEFETWDKRKQNGFVGEMLQEWSDKFNAPRIAVYQAVEKGPLYEQWPPKSHSMIYGEAGADPAAVIRTFATRAFRRPVADEQVARYVALAKSSSEGMRTAIEAILCSPRFLYLHEGADALDDYAIASRLSYFFWSSMPDDPLLTLAADGKLRDRAVLAQQVDRMLADPRSEHFVNDFTWGWLYLQNTVDMAPDPVKYYDFKRHRIADSMLKETRLFFRDVLDTNAPITRMIDGDSTFVNAYMARHYGLPEVPTTAGFQKVSWQPGNRRAGILGHASVLTASANGVDTSPVVRGIWLLEHLLGTPPNPPPPDVPISEPDSRGDLSIKEIYAKHRNVESCRDCHKKIDPLGFALENYDAVGQWRDKYESGREVDSTGVMPNGTKFADSADLIASLRKSPESFERNLTTKLLLYATGRPIEVTDRREVDAVTARAKAKGNGLRDLLVEVVNSSIFLNK